MASKTLNAALKKKLAKVELVILDVDGVLTDGRIFWVENSGWSRYFHVKDGYGIKLLQRAGFHLAVITAGDSKDVRERVKYLGIEHIFLGNEDKMGAYEQVLKATGLKDDQVAYIADELFDIPLLKRVGFSATVPHAVDQVKKAVHYVTQHEGGQGAVREIVEALLAAHPKRSVIKPAPKALKPGQ